MVDKILSCYSPCFHHFCPIDWLSLSMVPRTVIEGFVSFVLTVVCVAIACGSLYEKFESINVSG